uniref:Uncharacterized protein n=1 Tax=Pipistrellus kuhlii TaxID=59472 RepID=A0A7J7XVS9_PIPKU|nr:hypothetical protein mPipKuh1_010416 [Pipistrellus kuhlii]
MMLRSIANTFLPVFFFLFSFFFFLHLSKVEGKDESMNRGLLMTPAFFWSQGNKEIIRKCRSFKKRNSIALQSKPLLESTDYFDSSPSVPTEICVGFPEQFVSTAHSFLSGSDAGKQAKPCLWE